MVSARLVESEVELLQPRRTPPVVRLRQVLVIGVFVYGWTVGPAAAHVEELKLETCNSLGHVVRNSEVVSCKLRVCLAGILACRYVRLGSGVCALVPYEFRVVRSVSVSPQRSSVKHLVYELPAYLSYGSPVCSAAGKAAVEILVCADCLRIANLQYPFVVRVQRLGYRRPEQ